MMGNRRNILSNDIDVFLAAMAEAVRDGGSAAIPDVRHPPCPVCSAAMNGDDGLWVCPGCGFRFGEYQLRGRRRHEPEILRDPDGNTR